MTYSYEYMRDALFTDQGQKKFLAIRDRVNALLNQSGAVRMHEAIAESTGDSWVTLACVDRLVELGEIREITGPDVVRQNRVFVKATRIEYL